MADDQVGAIISEVPATGRFSSRIRMGLVLLRLAGAG